MAVGGCHGPVAQGTPLDPAGHLPPSQAWWQGRTSSGPIVPTSPQAGPVNPKGRRDPSPRQGLALSSHLRPLLAVLPQPKLLAKAHDSSREGRGWPVTPLRERDGLPVASCRS